MNESLPTEPKFSRGCFNNWLIVLFLFLPLVLGAGKDDDGARRSINGFYNLYLKLHPFGVPNEQVQAKLNPYLSSSLRQQLKHALMAEQRYAIKNRNEVPPLVESDLFSSLFEGASGFKIASCELQEKAGACLVDFTYGGADKKTMRWHDRVYLIREPRGWMIDDVEYLGDWQFMHKGRLTTLLKEVIAESNKS
ncbi:MAG TPA: DUF3828 domain-containing protein [Candidatus Binatus sp.]|nr:DUF3828 domain-containing protein [Candidatus Binatus sp.]